MKQGMKSTNYWAQKAQYARKTSAQSYLRPGKADGFAKKRLSLGECSGGDCSIGCGSHGCDSPGCDGSCSG